MIDWRERGLVWSSLDKAVLYFNLGVNTLDCCFLVMFQGGERRGSLEMACVLVSSRGEFKPEVLNLPYPRKSSWGGAQLVLHGHLLMQQACGGSLGIHMATECLGDGDVGQRTTFQDSLAHPTS